MSRDHRLDRGERLRPPGLDDLRQRLARHQPSLAQLGAEPPAALDVALTA